MVIAALLLISAGIVLVNARSPVSEYKDANTWGGFGATVGNNTDDTSPSRIATPETGQATDTAIPQLSYTSGTAEQSEDALSVLRLLAEAASTSGVYISRIDELTIENLYKLLPRGFGTATTATIRRSPREQALYTYGNEAGAPIEAYGSIHRNQSYSIADFIADRGNSAKQAAVSRIGDDLSAVGKELGALTSVPSDVRAMHETLSRSYLTMGEKLRAFSGARTDEELLAASLAYNTSVEEFNKAFIALATFFEIAEVRFGAGEPGRVFGFGGP